MFSVHYLQMHARVFARIPPPVVSRRNVSQENRHARLRLPFSGGSRDFSCRHHVRFPSLGNPPQSLSSSLQTASCFSTSWGAVEPALRNAFSAFSTPNTVYTLAPSPGRTVSNSS